MEKKLIKTSLGNLISAIDTQLIASDIKDSSLRNELTSILLSEILTYQYIPEIKNNYW